MEECVGVVGMEVLQTRSNVIFTLAAGVRAELVSCFVENKLVAVTAHARTSTPSMTAP